MHMPDKLTSMQQAASRVRDGAHIVMSGNLQRAPIAFLRALIRRGVRDLRLIGVTGGELDIDLPVGAGAVAAVDTCSVTLGTFARTAPNFARFAQTGQVRALDNT
jgi:glutaconate CoA-transferase subunit A